MKEAMYVLLFLLPFLAWTKNDDSLSFKEKTSEMKIGLSFSYKAVEPVLDAPTKRRNETKKNEPAPSRKARSRCH